MLTVSARVANLSNSVNSVSAPAPTSALANRAPVDGDIVLRELPPRGKINLRGDAGDGEFTAAAAVALGVALPVAANTVAVTDGVTVFWLGPDEWLIHCKLTDTDAWLQQLRARLTGMHYAATEVTDYFTVLELRGEQAAEVLARGCPLDLHPRAFPAGACAQTRFGNATVLLHKPAAVDNTVNNTVDNTVDSTVFRIQVRWSFAGYVWDYLTTVIDSQAA